MHFHFQLANQYFAGMYRIEDVVTPILWGLRALGHRVTTGIMPDLPSWPSVVVMIEYFDRVGYPEELIGWKTTGARKCLGMICTEDIDDPLVMEDPRFPRRREGLLRVLPHCDFVWPLVPGYESGYVDADRLGFVDYGYCEALRWDGLPATERDIDVLFYATMNDRRRRLSDGFARRGLRVAATRGSLPSYIRRNLMARSKLVLDVRRGEEVKYTSPSRICAALQMGSTVVSELFDTSRLGALYPYTEACALGEVEERCVALARAPDVVERGLAARERFRRETSMADNLRRAMDLPVFRELEAEGGRP
jgi:hypothetical protein